MFVIYVSAQGSYEMSKRTDVALKQVNWTSLLHHPRLNHNLYK